MSRYAAFQKNLDFFKLLAVKGRKWVDDNVPRHDMLPLKERHVNSLFSHVYKELNLPIRHLVLDEAQFAKNIATKTYDAVSNLWYERIMLLSGTFLANRWHDLFGLISLIPGHPFTNPQQFMKTFAQKEEDGIFTKPSKSKINRLIKFMMAFTIDRPISLLNLLPLKRQYHDFSLDATQEANVAYFVAKYLRLIKTANKTSVFAASASSTQNKQKAMMQATQALLCCASNLLLTPQKLSQTQHLNSQARKLQERFAAARAAKGDSFNIETIYEMIFPKGTDFKQLMSFDAVSEEIFNTVVQIDQGETPEVEVDLEQLLEADTAVHLDQAGITVPDKQAATNKASNESLHADHNDSSDEESPVDYLYLKPGEEYPKFLLRLKAMTDEELFSTKIITIIKLMSGIRSSYPGEGIVVFSRYLKFLDMLVEAMSRNNALSDLKPLLFNGKLDILQRDFSQQIFNLPNNTRPLLITAASGGSSLNLAGGSHVIQCEPWWNANDEDQAQSRCWRLGQTRNVFVYAIRGTNSLIDHVMAKSKFEKMSTNIAITKPLRRKDDDVVIIPKQYRGGVGEN